MSLMTKKCMRCIRRPTATTTQENKNNETINGNLIQKSTATVMERKKSSMVQLWRYIMRDWLRNTQKL